MTAKTLDSEKEPAPGSSNHPAPVHDFIGSEYIQIRSVLFAVLAFGAFLSCGRGCRRGCGLGLGLHWGAGYRRGGFAVAAGCGPDWGAGGDGRNNCGFTHIIMFLFVSFN
jgi:hypothetical protein